MNPSSIKKIINKKVTVIVLKDQIPIYKRHSPIFPNKLLQTKLSLTKIKILKK